MASLVAQTVKNLPALQEKQVQSLVEKTPGRGPGNPTHSSILELRIPWTWGIHVNPWLIHVNE